MATLCRTLQRAARTSDRSTRYIMATLCGTKNWATHWVFHWSGPWPSEDGIPVVRHYRNHCTDWATWLTTQMCFVRQTTSLSCTRSLTTWGRWMTVKCTWSLLTSTAISSLSIHTVGWKICSKETDCWVSCLNMNTKLLSLSTHVHTTNRCSR